jgi:hypothetical protein
LLNKLKAKFTSELRLAKSHYNLSWAAVVSIILFPFFFLIFQIILTLPGNYKYILLFWGENKAFENIQFAFFLLGALLSLRIAWLTKLQLERPMVWGFYFLLFLLLIFIAMEEIAWGQQFLHFRTPEFIRDFNAQNEFTLHNVELLQRRSDILNFAFSIAALSGVYFSRQKVLKNLFIPRVLFPWIFFLVILSTMGVFNDLVSISEQIDFTIHKQTETVELLIAIGSFLFLLLNSRLYSQKYVFWKDIADVKLATKHLSITDVEGRQISVPLSRYSWLANVSQAKQKNYYVGERGDCIRWPQLENELCLQDILNTSVSPDANEKFASQHLAIGNLLVIALVALATFAWLVLLPSDPENSFLFGFSSARMLMVATSLAVAALLFRSWRRAKIDRAWLIKLSSWLHTVLFAKGRSLIVLILSAAGFVGSLIFLVISFVHADPYIRGILSRLAPWALFSLTISVQVFQYILRKLLHYSRLGLALADTFTISKEHLILTLSDNRKISLPLDFYPWLSATLTKNQKMYVSVANGIRLRWPNINEEICAQHFLDGKHSFQ